MSEETKHIGWWTPIKVGILLSIIVLLAFIIMAFQRNCVYLPSEVLECRRNWRWFWSSPPNEIGDTLAGFAGTLAFIWIVATVWLQSNELSEQRQVLMAQKEEFKAMVSAQNAQVAALMAQAAMLEDEKRRRDEAATVAFLDESLRSLRLELSLSWLQATGWRFSKGTFLGSVAVPAGGRIVRQTRLIQHYGGPTKFDSIEQILPFLPAMLLEVQSDLKKILQECDTLDSSPSRDEFISISSRIEKLLPFINELSSAPSERFRRLKLEDSFDLLNGFIKDDRLWGLTP